MAVALDPLVTLATVAASTTTIRLGTNVLVAPWYRPALLARSLASLDVLSRGRLDVGLGLGWSADEYDAVGVPQRELASRQDDLLDALEALWRPGVEAVSYEGRDFRIGPSSFRPRPVQQPRPPILLAAYTPAGLDRAGRRANGWTPAGLDIPTTAAMWGMVLAAAEAAGRDPDQLSLVVRANVHHSLVPLGADRPTYHGSVDQIAADVARGVRDRRPASDPRPAGVDERGRGVPGSRRRHHCRQPEWVSRPDQSHQSRTPQSRTSHRTKGIEPMTRSTALRIATLALAVVAVTAIGGTVLRRRRRADDLLPDLAPPRHRQRPLPAHLEPRRRDRRPLPTHAEPRQRDRRPRPTHVERRRHDRPHVSAHVECRRRDRRALPTHVEPRRRSLRRLPVAVPDDTMNGLLLARVARDSGPAPLWSGDAVPSWPFAHSHTLAMAPRRSTTWRTNAAATRPHNPSHTTQHHATHTIRRLR